METAYQILISLLSAIVVGTISFLFKPMKRFINKIIGRDDGARHYTKRSGEKIYIFPKKQETRISVSVLARIEDDGKFLLKAKKPDSYRQDSTFKPLGGVVKVSGKISKTLKKKGDIRYDNVTRYSAKGEELRIYMNLGDNKIIHKAIYSESLSYYHAELMREMREELGNISGEKLSEIFELELQQPFSIQVHYTEPDFSFLRQHDYVHHIIFNVKIKDKKLFNKTVNENKRLKWITLSGSENKAITSRLLDTHNNFRKFK